MPPGRKKTDQGTSPAQFMNETHGSTNSAVPAASVTPAWVYWVRGLLGVALVGAGYLAWVSIHNGPVAGCGPTSGCGQVLQNPWAYWLDIPVSVPALLVYLALLGTTVLLQKRPAPDEERGAWAATIALAVIVAGAALWFVGLQIFVIKAYCKFCMIAHACGLAAALLCLWHIPLARDPATPMWAAGSGLRGVPRAGVASVAAIGLAGVMALAGGQLLVPRKLNVVRDLRPAGRPVAGQTNAINGTPGEGNSAAPTPASPQPHLVAPRQLSLYSNAFLLQLDTVPMIGSPDATNVIVYVFDYTCSHCRALHPILIRAQRRFGPQLGIVSLPMPISTNCNPFLPPQSHSIANACEYARLGLAVWRAKPAVHGQFEEWMFAGARPAPVAQAKEYAAQLVGPDALEAALKDPWIEQQLLLDCRLHHINWMVSEQPVMPQLIIGDAISTGPLNSVEHLVLLLNHYLGLTAPPPPVSGGQGEASF